MIRSYVEPIGTGAVAFVALVALLWFPYAVWQYRRRGQFSARRALSEGSFVLYLACAWALVLAPFPETQAAACLRHTQPNLEAFRWVTDVQNSLARSSSPTWRALLTNGPLFVRLFNVALTVPFGVFLRRWYRRGFLVTTLAGFALSLAFELTQLTGIWGIYDCPYRLFDVDDLMANTLGASLGWLLAPIFILLPKRKDSDDLAIVADHAGLFRRLVALLCDLLVWLLGYVSVLFAFVALAALTGMQVRPSTLATAAWIGSFLVTFVGLPLVLRGATPGKALVRLSTGRARNPARPAAAWAQLVRALVLFLPLVGTFTAASWVQLAYHRDWLTLATLAGIPLTWALLLGLVALGRRDRRSIPDLMAGTVVVVVRPADVNASQEPVPALGPAQVDRN